MLVFFFNDTATTEIYTLSLHDALPISTAQCARSRLRPGARGVARDCGGSRIHPLVWRDGGDSAGRAASSARGVGARSEEHTSELQSRQYLVCRLLLEKKKQCATSPTAR